MSLTDGAHRDGDLTNMAPRVCGARLMKRVLVNDAAGGASIKDGRVRTTLVVTTS